MYEVGTIRVADPSDYDGRILVETFDYHAMRNEPWWAVPAWEETFFHELAGPFASFNDAVFAVHEALKWGLNRPYVTLYGSK